LSRNEGDDEMFEIFYNLYHYMEHQIIKANMSDDIAVLDEVIPIVSNLLETWNMIPEDFHNIASN